MSSDFSSLFNENNSYADNAEVGFLTIDNLIDLTTAKIVGLPVDNSTIIFPNNVIEVAPGGITNTQLATNSVQNSNIVSMDAGKLTGTVTIPISSSTVYVDNVYEKTAGHGVVINNNLSVEQNAIFPNLATNGIAGINSSNNLTSTTLTNGQLLIGNSGNAPIATTITGTANQVNVTNGAGSVTLSTPQNINSAASPTFTGLNLSGLSASSLVGTDGSKNLTSSVSGISPGFTGLNLSGLSASSLVGTDGSKNLTSSVSSLNPGFTGLNLSGLTASSLVGTDGSKNLTSSVSGISPGFTGLTLSGLTASQAVVSNSSKALSSLAYTTAATANTLVERDGSGNINANNFSGSSSGTNSGDVTLGAVSASSNANAAQLTGQQLQLCVANGSNPGVISTSAQTIAGVKLFNSLPLQIGTSTDTATTRFITALDSTMTTGNSRYITFGYANSSNNQAELIYTHNANGGMGTSGNESSDSNRLTIGFNGQQIIYLDTFGRSGIGMAPSSTIVTSTTFSSTSTFTIPYGCTRLLVKMWGSGGGGGSGSNIPTGGGGSAIISYVAVSYGQTYTLLIGLGGSSESGGASYTGGGVGGSYPFQGGTPGYAGDHNGRGGGGQSTALFLNNVSSYTVLLCAAGGGGGGLGLAAQNAGGGGSNATNATYGGKAGALGIGGNPGQDTYDAAARGGTNAVSSATQSTLLSFGGAGGTPNQLSNSWAGGGGGGWAGGGSGGTSANGDSDSGGGGQSYCPNGTIYDGNGKTAGNNTDSDYPGSNPGLAGSGSSTTGNSGGNGNSGYTKIYFLNDCALSVGGQTVIQGDLLPYTNNLNNLGNSSNIWTNLCTNAANINGLTASSLVATDASKNLTSTVSGLSPGFTGLNLSGLTASGLIATDGSKNLTTSVTGLTPTFTNVILSAATASNFYASGTWTGTMGDGTHNFTLSTNSCNYVRIGNMYFCSIYLVWSSIGSASGNIAISLPATISNSAWSRAEGPLGYFSGISYTNQISAIGMGGTSIMNIVDSSKTGGSSNFLTNTAFGTSGQIQISINFSV